MVLSQFLDSHLDRLNADEREALGRLLELPDNDLWDMVAGRQQAPDPGCAHLLIYLR
ncbi:MAG: succinate dehydrogenase assembly factor 2 [Burkholderiales bacterium]